MATCLISLSEQAFFTVVTAALEAYRLDHSPELDGSGVELETFGYLWGHQGSTSSGEQVYRIAQASVSTSAQRLNGTVSVNEGFHALKNAFVEAYFPEMKFLGDFHSHPYSTGRDGVHTELDLERNRLYQFSTPDFDNAKAMQREGRDYRVGLVVTVFERETPVRRSSKYLDESSCIRFQYDDMTIWLKAYAWVGDGYRRKTDRKVTLVCPSVGFSLS